MLESSHMALPEVFPIFIPFDVVSRGTVRKAASSLSFFSMNSDPEIILPH